MLMDKVKVDWDRYAEQYDNITMSGSNPAYNQLVDKVITFFQKLSIKKDSLIVDFGGGTGNFAIPIAELYPNSKVVMIDSSQGMLKKAKKKIDERKIKNIDVVYGDITKDIPKIAKQYSGSFNSSRALFSLYL